MLPQSQVSLASLIAWDLLNSDCPFFLKASIGYSFSLRASPTITGAAWLVTSSSPGAASAGFSLSQSSKSQLVRWGAASLGCSCRARHQHPLTQLHFCATIILFTLQAHTEGQPPVPGRELASGPPPSIARVSGGFQRELEQDPAAICSPPPGGTPPLQTAHRKTASILQVPPPMYK